jgi:O-acetyl-ADP-ribose deacetylase (regulator of RNase III)
MIMLVINQDITKVNRGIITHAVNTRGVMGSGLALQIFRQMRSGMIQVIEVGDDLYQSIISQECPNAIICNTR